MVKYASVKVSYHKLTQWELAAIDTALEYFADNAQTQECEHAPRMIQDLRDLASKVRAAKGGKLRFAYLQN